MANRIWISTDGNATATTSWSGGAVPASNDVVIFDPAASSVSPRTNLDFGASGVNLAEMLIMPGWRLPIGTYGSPWKSESAVIRHYGDCILFYQSKNNGIEFDTRDIYVDTAFKGPACVFSKGTATAFLRLVVNRGEVQFDTTCAPFQAWVGVPGRSQNDARLVLQNQAVVDPSIVLYSGVVVNNAGIAASGSRYMVYGGSWLQDQGYIDEMHILGGRVILNATDGSARIVMSGGSLDTSQTPRARTLASVIQYGGDFVKSTQTIVTNYKDARLQRR